LRHPYLILALLMASSVDTVGCSRSAPQAEAEQGQGHAAPGCSVACLDARAACYAKVVEAGEVCARPAGATSPSAAPDLLRCASEQADVRLACARAYGRCLAACQGSDRGTPPREELVTLTLRASCHERTAQDSVNCLQKVVEKCAGRQQPTTAATDCLAEETASCLQASVRAEAGCLEAD